MKDRSIFFFLCLIGGFFLIGTALLYRSSPESLPERTEQALRTEGCDGLSAAFVGDRVFLLGEVSTENELKQAIEVVKRVEGVGTVDDSHASVKVRPGSPYLSLAFVGNHLSLRGQVARDETKNEILVSLKEIYPEAEINHRRLVVSDDVADYAGFAEAPTKLVGVGEKERERGVVAAVGGDMVWEVMQSGDGTDEIKARLAKVLPEAEVEETLDEFDDVLTAEHLRDDNSEVHGALAESEDRLTEMVEAVKSMEAELTDVQDALKAANERADLTEGMLSMSREELAKTEAELVKVRENLMVKVRELAGANEARSGLESQVAATSDRLAESLVELKAAAQEITRSAAIAEDQKLALVRMETGIKERESQMAALQKRLASTEATAEAVRAQLVEMGKIHTSSLAEAERRIQSVQEDSADMVEKMRGEVQRLEGELATANAKADEIESKLEKLKSVQVPTVPGAISKSPGYNAGLDAVRDAAATASERARDAAVEGVERAKAIGRDRSSEEKVKDEPEEADPSGKPTPYLMHRGGLKIQSAIKFSAKNISREGAAPRAESAEGAGPSEALWRQLEERDRKIVELESQRADERRTEGELISVLREENAALRGALEMVIDLGDTSGGENWEAPETTVLEAPEGDEIFAGDPFEKVFDRIESRLDTVGSLIPSEDDPASTTDDLDRKSALAEAFGEIATLQARVADLETELSEALFEQSQAVEAAAQNARRAADFEFLANVAHRQIPLQFNQASTQGNGATSFARPVQVDSQLRSILAYP